MTQTPPTAPQPAAMPAEDRSVLTVIDASKLPKHLAGLLAWLPLSDWHLIEARVCHFPFTRDLVDVTGFIDRVWQQANRAENRSGASRITGAEMDTFRSRYDQSVRALVEVGVELARRTGLSEILGRNRRLLEKFGIAINGEKSSKPADSNIEAA